MKCEWTYDEWHDCWETGCGNTFQFIDGTPKDNKMRFCPYCGKEIEQVRKGGE